MGSHTNALLTGKKLLAKIVTKEQKPTVFCPCLTACYMFMHQAKLGALFFYNAMTLKYNAIVLYRVQLDLF